jgi:hypothetical protein
MNTTQAAATDVAATIANQIGNRALVMFGATNLLGDANTLQFKIGKNASKATHVRVTLDPSDTYTVEFIRVGRSPHFTVTPIDSQSMVYGDQLRTVIGTFTGMYWNL